MQQLLNWTLKAIREEDSSFSWMEECRFEWVPLANSILSNIIDAKSILMLSDDEHRWMVEYILYDINSVNKKRPMLPFYDLNSYLPSVSRTKSTQQIQMLEDMLSISHPQGYVYWYIGSANDTNAKLAYRNEDSFMWIIGEQMQNSFKFSPIDKNKDLKLMQLYKLFDKTLSATLFSQIELDR